jgi:hypothetical protein
VRLCQILRQTLDRYWLDSPLSTSIAGRDKLQELSFACDAQAFMASLLDRRGREMLLIPAISLCCCRLPDTARDSSEGG